VRVWTVFIGVWVWFSRRTVISKFSFHFCRNSWRIVSLRSEGLSSSHKARYSMELVVAMYLHISLVGLCVLEPNAIVHWV
jgi:hypothetical protein